MNGNRFWRNRRLALNVSSISGGKKLKDKEFITLCRALDLKPNDSIIVRKFVDTDKEYVVVLEQLQYDKETGVAYLKSNRGNVTLASEIYSLERNRRLKGNSSKKE